MSDDPLPAVITRQMLTDLFESIKEQEREPHRCVVHPKGGVCFDCGQPWHLVNGRMERLTH